jgi:hypothetical protein
MTTSVAEAANPLRWLLEEHQSFDNILGTWKILYFV